MVRGRLLEGDCVEKVVILYRVQLSRRDIGMLYELILIVLKYDGIL